MTCGRFSEHTNEELGILKRYIILLILGFLTIFSGFVILMIAAAFSDGSTNSGAFILIWPFPIILVAGSEAPWTILLAAILTILSIMMFLVFRREKG